MNIDNATPIRLFDGIQDDSGGTVPDQRDQVPMHCPLWMIQSPQGLTGAQFLSLGAAKLHYGEEAFNEFSKYFSHQTMGAQVSGSEGNMAFFMRCVSQTAKKAKLRLSAEIVKSDNAPAIEVDAEGYAVIDGVTQEPKLKTDGTTSMAQFVRWFVEEVPGEIGENPEAITPGPNPDPVDGTDSTILPIWDFEAPDYGTGATNSGFRLTFPNKKSSNLPDVEAFTDAAVLPARFQFVRRRNSTSSPLVQKSLLTAEYVDIGIIDGEVRNLSTNMIYSHDRCIKEFYKVEPGDEIKLPVFGGMFFHKDNYDRLLDQLFLGENTTRSENGLEPIPDGLKYMFNPFTLVDFEGRHYSTLRYYAGSLRFSSVTTHYLRGGDDGDVGEQYLAQEVENRMADMWDDVESPMLDRLRYPFHHFWDTGFPHSTKEAIMAILGKRPDTFVGLCTQDLAQPENDLATETSIASTLETKVRLYPESVVHGTGTCRAAIWQHMGTLGDSLAKRRYPLIFDVIRAVSAYMGSVNGMRGNRPDNSPYNQLASFTKATNAWAPHDAREKFWSTGCNYVQSKGLKKLFWPAQQTVYRDDTSVLNSLYNVFVAIDIIAIQDYIWTELTGNTDLEDPEFIDKSNKLFDALTANRYHNRVVLERTTYFTEMDAARNYSWTMDVTMRGRGMKTVGALNLIAARTRQAA